MSDDTALQDLSPQDVQARKWLLQYLDLAGDPPKRKPSPDPGPKSKATEDIQPGQQTRPGFQESLRTEAILNRLDRLKLPSDATPRQVEALNKLLEPARQQARDQKFEAADKSVEQCEALFKEQVKAILARRPRTERFKKIPPTMSFTRGQGQRLRAAEEKYLTAETEGRAEDAQRALEECEALQKAVAQETEAARKVRDRVGSLGDPAQALPEEVRRLKLQRDAIEDDLRNDLRAEADSKADALALDVQSVVNQVKADKATGQDLAKKVLDAINTFAKDLADAGAPYLEDDVLSSALRAHPEGAPIKSSDDLIEACRAGTATRAQALELARTHASLMDAVSAASVAINESLGQARTSYTLIDQALARAGTTIGEIEPHNKLDYVPKLWSAWPSDHIPKPGLDDLPDSPQLEGLRTKHADLDADRLEGKLQLERTAGVGGTAIDWDALVTKAEKLASDAAKAKTDYYGVLSEHLYPEFDTAKRKKEKDLSDAKGRITNALSKVNALEKAREGLSKEDLVLLESIVQLAGGASSALKKIKEQVIPYFSGRTKAIEEGGRKVDSMRSTDGNAPDPVPEDPTVFEKQSYTKVGQLSGKDLYVRFDDSVTTSKHYDTKYKEARDNGVIPSTSTGKAGIKNEPYGWVVKVTLNTANASSTLDNTMSPRASAGLKVSTGSTPAFYLNFDEWVARH